MCENGVVDVMNGFFYIFENDLFFFLVEVARRQYRNKVKSNFHN